MMVALTAALLAALAITGSACADTEAPAVTDASKPIPFNAGPAVPKDGGKDGPFASVVGAGVDARLRRLHCYRADVYRENGWWFVMFYPFP